MNYRWEIQSDFQFNLGAETEREWLDNMRKSNDDVGTSKVKPEELPDEIACSSSNTKIHNDDESSVEMHPHENIHEDDVDMENEQNVMDPPVDFNVEGEMNEEAE